MTDTTYETAKVSNMFWSGKMHVTVDAGMPGLGRKDGCSPAAPQTTALTMLDDWIYKCCAMSAGCGRGSAPTGVRTRGLRRK